MAIPVAFDRNLRLIAGTGNTLATANMTYASKKRLMKQFQGVDADVVVIDIGAGTNYHALDFFLMTDIHVAVATPEPTSVLDLYPVHQIGGDSSRTLLFSCAQSDVGGSIQP